LKTLTNFEDSLVSATRRYATRRYATRRYATPEVQVVGEEEGTGKFEDSLVRGTGTGWHQEQISFADGRQ